MPIKASTVARREKKKRSQIECWRCGEFGITENGSALLIIEYADASFSGSFLAPLCDGCLQHPHNHLERIPRR